MQFSLFQLPPIAVFFVLLYKCICHVWSLHTLKFPFENIIRVICSPLSFILALFFYWDEMKRSLIWLLEEIEVTTKLLVKDDAQYFISSVPYTSLNQDEWIHFSFRTHAPGRTCHPLLLTSHSPLPRETVTVAMESQRCLVVFVYLHEFFDVSTRVMLEKAREEQIRRENKMVKCLFFNVIIFHIQA